MQIKTLTLRPTENFSQFAQHMTHVSLPRAPWDAPSATVSPRPETEPDPRITLCRPRKVKRHESMAVTAALTEIRNAWREYAGEI